MRQPVTVAAPDYESGCLTDDFRGIQRHGLTGQATCLSGIPLPKLLQRMMQFPGGCLRAGPGQTKITTTTATQQVCIQTGPANWTMHC